MPENLGLAVQREGTLIHVFDDRILTHDNERQRD